MQSTIWYKNRLLAMTPAEIAWRIAMAAQNFADRFRLAFRNYPSESEISRHIADECEAGFHVPSGMDASELLAIPLSARQTLLRRAEKIAAHSLRLFDLDDVFLGNPIDWNRDHAHGIAAPLKSSHSIDYRDFRETGDCKLVWEPNRHQHLPVLGRAYMATGDLRFALEAVDQIRSWMHQCPFGKGMNWRSPLELGIRLINWVWTIDLIRESGTVAGLFRPAFLHCVYLHLWEITRKYSRGSSANNHLVGEAAGVFAASAYFSELPGAAAWAEESRSLLEREIISQTFEDGGSREQAMGYHVFALQFFLVAGLVGRWSGREFSRRFWRRLERMFEFAAALGEGSGQPPFFGDSDDGYVLDLGLGPPELKDLLCIGAVIFNSADFKRSSGEFREAAYWLLGPEAKQRFDAIPSTRTPIRLLSKRFEKSGYCILQCGTGGSRECVSVVMDCAELGYQSIAAHGHADALSFILSAFGQEVFVDPGTYDYFTFPQWRSYFRSTRAHNALAVDDQDQSVMLGPFMWGHRADVRFIEWEPWPGGGGRLVAEHDGYRRLRDPVIHRRSLVLNPRTLEVTITDEVAAGARHRVALYFHLSERCRVSLLSPSQVSIYLPEGRLALTVDPRLSLTVLEGSEKPMGGWVSRGYHRKQPASTIVARGECRGRDSFRSVIKIAAAKG